MIMTLCALKESEVNLLFSFENHCVLAKKSTNVCLSVIVNSYVSEMLTSYSNQNKLDSNN